MDSGTTASLRGVWGNSSSDVFIVGSKGTILHYNGNTWRKMVIDTDFDFDGIWGNSSSDVFIVLGSNMRHYDGNSWKKILLRDNHNPLYDVWSSFPSDVFAVGWRNTIVHYDGINDRTMTSSLIKNLENNSDCSRLRSVWGSSSSDVYAVGDSGVILHYNGSKWRLARPSQQDENIINGIVGLGIIIFGAFLLTRKWKMAFWWSWIVFILITYSWVTVSFGYPVYAYLQPLPLSLFLSLVIWLGLRTFRGSLGFNKGWVSL